MVTSGYAFGKFDAKGFAKSIAPKQPVKAGKPPQRTPDFVFSEKISPEQAVVYRLSGCGFPFPSVKDPQVLTFLLAQ